MEVWYLIWGLRTISLKLNSRDWTKRSILRKSTMSWGSATMRRRTEDLVPKSQNSSNKSRATRKQSRLKQGKLRVLNWLLKNTNPQSRGYRSQVWISMKRTRKSPTILLRSSNWETLLGILKTRPQNFSVRFLKWLAKRRDSRMRIKNSRKRKISKVSSRAILRLEDLLRWPRPTRSKRSKKICWTTFQSRTKTTKNPSKNRQNSCVR